MWLSEKQVSSLAALYGTPLFVYSRQQLRERSEELLNLKMPFGLNIRYAVKANSHPEIIKLLDSLGLEFDASSSYEASNLLQLGIAGHKISLSSQQSAHNLAELLDSGVQYVATSMHQLELFANVAGSGSEITLRVNPSIDRAGHNNRTSTSGRSSAFGLWHEYITEALTFAEQNNIKITRLHMHIGSGADPSIWDHAMVSALEIVRRMPDIRCLNIGGGYKIVRHESEKEADMQKIGRVFAKNLRSFATETDRKLKIELEPGTWFVAHAGILIARVDDIVDTGKHGYKFLRLDTGMNDIIRPAMYGAYHDIIVLSDSREQADYVVAGHNCETGDILTPAPEDPEHIVPRRLKKANIGDIVIIADTGAYCASFSTHGYNAFPSAQEIIV